MNSPSTPDPAGWWEQLLRWLRSLFAPTDSPAQQPQRAPTSRGADEGDRFAIELLRDLAAHLAQEPGGNQQEIERELLARRGAAPTSAGATGVGRVECVISKTSAARATVELRVLRLGDVKATILSLKRETGWDDLPQEVRSAFIRLPAKEQVFVLIDGIVPDPTQPT